jgi:2-keto-4-pentenoate hydratase/2-oxohepta-3-ene-1,7-dioic acid hydratase in catechol pathway
MKFCSFIASGVNAYGIVYNDEIRAVGEEFAARYPDLKSAITANVLVPAAQSAMTGVSYSLSAVRFMPLIPSPAKILCVGMNYMAHIREMGRETAWSVTVNRLCDRAYRAIMTSRANSPLS